ncbi:N-acetylglutamate synthase [Pokkaliibacter plantistimulans]|uniref:Amino-acid acetyltransferase n=1 Tax=Pokkaliibacter plantistimulans TaxID=1635171 RepID=A0ABX5M605_9GAMM|nr:amino-acid N-acetyltransferase [Pokkaliibacter plantistimulans]PXF33108.1 N-acetylglutamate synthase [Pokkaliibacter plantistimulans]
MNNQAQVNVSWFRHSSPYINAHRGKTFVLMLGGEALEHSNFANIIHDISLLNSLGVRLVLVYGTRPQIEARLQERGLPSRMYQHQRITDEATLNCVKEAVGLARIDIEAQLSLGLANSPMFNAQIRVVGGNVVTARPLGVRDGQDMCYTGEVRRVDANAINRLLAEGNIVVLSNLGYSPTGEVFNLSVEDVATRTATALKADKLIAFGDEPGVVNKDGEVINELLAAKAERLVKQHLASLGEHEPISQLARILKALVDACRGGVKRTHLISYQTDGALLTELFSREGSGTMVIQESYEQMRQATIEDVGGLIELLRPMEEAGILVRRSRELLEAEIERFTVVDRDGTIIGCMALYPFPDEGCAELACVAVHSEYRGDDRGLQMLEHIERRAREMGLRELFVLTTRTAHWFVENGFVLSPLTRLPAKKKELYNYQRNSKVFFKTL